MLKVLWLHVARRIRRLLRRIFAQRTMGAQLLLTDEHKRIFLVRRRDTKMWVFPGGAVDRFEHPRDAALRETLEEAGLKISPDDITLVQCYLSTYSGWPDYIFLYKANVQSKRHKPSFRSIEIDAGDFFEPHNLPKLQPGTDRRLKEHFKKAPISLQW